MDDYTALGERVKYPNSYFFMCLGSHFRTVGQSCRRVLGLPIG